MGNHKWLIGWLVIGGIGIYNGWWGSYYDSVFEFFLWACILIPLYIWVTETIRK